MDLSLWWRERRWLELSELLQQLPTSARWRVAARSDPEQVAAMLDELTAAGGADPAAEYAPPATEWDLHASLLRAVHGALLTIISTLTGKDLADREFPAPVDPLEEAREQRLREMRAAHQADLIRQLMPGGPRAT